MFQIRIFLLFEINIRSDSFSYVRITEWPPIQWEIAAHSDYDMFSKYKYLTVNLVLPTSVFALAS